MYGMYVFLYVFVMCNVIYRDKYCMSAVRNIFKFPFKIYRNTDSYHPDTQEWADGCESLEEDVSQKGEANWKMPRKKQQNPQPVKCKCPLFFVVLNLNRE